MRYSVSAIINGRIQKSEQNQSKTCEKEKEVKTEVIDDDDDCFYVRAYLIRFLQISTHRDFILRLPDCSRVLGACQSTAPQRKRALVQSLDHTCRIGN